MTGAGTRHPRRPRRVRSARESLLAIALALEAALAFFVTMAVFGLQLLPPAAALGGGAALFVALVTGALLLRHRWVMWVGWVLQLVLLATGLIIPLMYFIGAGFVAIWIYCFITGTRLDRRNATVQNPEE